MTEHLFYRHMPALRICYSINLHEHHGEIMLRIGMLAGALDFKGANFRTFTYAHLSRIVEYSTYMLLLLGEKDPMGRYIDEFEAAKAKHPGHTFDLTEVPNLDKYWALAEEAGEVAAALTYDNDKDTGHRAEVVSEVVQVGALALAWMVAICKMDKSR